MKKLLAIFALMTVAALTFAQKAGDKVSFSTKSLEGKEISDDMFAKNKVTMLNIWGTFCPPCIKEMPDLAKLNEANKEKGVEVAGIVIDLTDRNGNIIPQAKKDADTIIAKTGANYTHIVPSKDMMNGLLRNVQAVPTTIFVNSEGKIIGQIYMGARSQKDWQKIIDGLLNK
ncbi:MAG: TlpA family protein disulfide reductase [Treponema sp.]|nr:TlpA family protein disulfide reductase [Treponema sp.]